MDEKLPKTIFVACPWCSGAIDLTAELGRISSGNARRPLPTPLKTSLYCPRCDACTLWVGFEPMARDSELDFGALRVTIVPSD